MLTSKTILRPVYRVGLGTPTARRFTKRTSRAQEQLTTISTDARNASDLQSVPGSRLRFLKGPFLVGMAVYVVCNVHSAEPFERRRKAHYYIHQHAEELEFGLSDRVSVEPDEAFALFKKMAYTWQAFLPNDMETD